MPEGLAERWQLEGRRLKIKEDKFKNYSSSSLSSEWFNLPSPNSKQTNNKGITSPMVVQWQRKIAQTGNDNDCVRKCRFDSRSIVIVIIRCDGVMQMFS
ncbi:hypothetical protein J6590_078103 [Homalodisca vitripennis]|nr:hypothetical protein J6590_078103 [Homalodisca vitripennis]